MCLFSYILSIFTLNCRDLFLATKYLMLFRSMLKQSDDLKMLSMCSSSGCVALLYTMFLFRVSSGTGPNSKVYLYLSACFFEPMYCIAWHHLFLLESCRNWYQKSWSKTEMSCVLVPLMLKLWFDTRNNRVSLFQCMAERSCLCRTWDNRSDRRPFHVQPIGFPARHSYTLQRHQNCFSQVRKTFDKPVPLDATNFYW